METTLIKGVQMYQIEKTHGQMDERWDQGE